jgi:peptide/nickel transport system ATP-binding protein
VLFISHDLLTAAGICQRLAISALHNFTLMEDVKEVLKAPQHPYTRKLIAAVPKWG